MDATDRTIVALLAENARRSFRDIGRHLHLSAPAVKRRVDRLVQAGVLLGYPAVVDPPAFGWHAEAFVDLYCEGKMAGRAIKRAVQQEPGVASAHTAAGEASAVLPGTPGPRAGARAHPRNRRCDAHRHRGGSVYPVHR